MARIFHIISKTLWQEAQQIGEYHPESLKVEGFIHCSKVDQVCQVANSFFKNESNLILLCINPDKILSKLVFEPPKETPFSQVKFPHIYGPLNIDAVEKIVDFRPTDSGFVLPKGILD